MPGSRNSFSAWFEVKQKENILILGPSPNRTDPASLGRWLTPVFFLTEQEGCAHAQYVSPCLVEFPRSSFRVLVAYTCLGPRGISFLAVLCFFCAGPANYTGLNSSEDGVKSF